MKLFLLFFALFVHIKNRDIPIRKYNVIHTGANIQPGGEKLGFARVAYQFVNDEAVNIEPSTPVNSQIAIEITNIALRSILQTIGQQRMYIKFIGTC
jgi:hypothetical protein